MIDSIRSIRSFLIGHSMTPDTVDRGIDHIEGEAGPVAASDYDMHTVADWGLGLTAIFAGISVGIYALVKWCKSAWKAEGFAKVGPAAGHQTPTQISPGQYQVSVDKPNLKVEIKDLSQEELQQAIADGATSAQDPNQKPVANAQKKAVSITVNGETKIKWGTDVLEVQEDLRSDALHGKSTYEQILVDLTDLEQAATLHKRNLSQQLTTFDARLTKDLAHLRLAVVLTPVNQQNEISFVKVPFGQVVIKNVDPSQAQQLTGGKGVSISVGGVETIIENTEVAEVQKAVHSDIYQKKKSYENLVLSEQGKADLTRADVLCRIQNINAGVKLVKIDEKQRASVITDCLKNIRSKNVNEHDLTIFNFIFNAQLTIDQLNAIPPLSDQEIEHLAWMVKKVSAGWKKEDGNHYFNMAIKGISDNLLAVYKHIFSPSIYEKAVKLHQFNPIDCLRKIGTSQFTPAHLSQLEKFFGFKATILHTISTLKSWPQLNQTELDFIERLIAHSMHPNGWTRECTDQLFDIAKQGLSDSLMNVYKLILPKTVSDRLALVKQNGLVQCLDKMGTNKFGANEVDVFKKFFKLSNLTLADFNNFKQLNSDEKALLISMVVDPDRSQEWDRDSTDYMLRMVPIGLSDGLLSVYKLIFSDAALKKSVSLVNELQAVELKFDDGALDAEEKFKLDDGTQIELLQHGRNFDSKDNYIDIKINGKTQRLYGVFLNTLQDKILTNKVNNKNNYHNTLSVDLNKRILNKTNDMAARLISDSNSSQNTSTKINQVQIDLDWVRNSYNRLIEFEVVDSPDLPSRVTAPQMVRDLVTEQGEGIGEFADRDVHIINAVYLFVNQMIAGNINGAVEGAVQRVVGVSSNTSGTRMTRKTAQTYILTIPANFADERKVFIRSNSPVGTGIYAWKGEFVFREDFYPKLADKSFLNTTDLGIASGTITSMSQVDLASEAIKAKATYNLTDENINSAIDFLFSRETTPAQVLQFARLHAVLTKFGSGTPISNQERDFFYQTYYLLDEEVSELERILEIQMPSDNVLKEYAVQLKKIEDAASWDEFINSQPNIGKVLEGVNEFGVNELNLRCLEFRNAESKNKGEKLQLIKAFFESRDVKDLDDSILTKFANLFTNVDPRREFEEFLNKHNLGKVANADISIQKRLADLVGHKDGGIKNESLASMPTDKLRDLFTIAYQLNSAQDDNAPALRKAFVECLYKQDGKVAK